MILLCLVRTHDEKITWTTIFIAYSYVLCIINILTFRHCEQIMITTLKFKDGSEISLTNDNVSELKNYFRARTIIKNVKDIDYFKSRVIDYIEKGVNKKSHIINSMRNHRDDVELAIEQLIKDKVIIANESTHKYCKVKIIELFIA